MREKAFGHRAKTRLFALIGAMALAGGSVGLAACGDDDDSTDGGGGAAVEGGEITMAQTSQPDFMDPALSYTVNGWEPMWIVYTPLLTYAHEEGARRRRADPGPRRGSAGGLVRRQDLHAHAA